jgi:hypothetical protein
MELVTLRAARAAVPRLEGQGTEVWRDADGRLCAVGFRDGDGHALFVPEIGTFSFRADADVITLRPVPASDADLIDDAYHRIALPLALQFSGSEVLHGSAVRFADGIVALCGRAGAGKSTLAYALGRRGHALCADDAVAFDPGGASPTVRSLPFRMRLRPESADWFDAPSLLKGHERTTAWVPGASAPLLTVFVLARPDGLPPGRIAIERMPAAEAFTAVLPHAYYVVLDDLAANRRLVNAYLDLVQTVPVFALEFHPALEAVDDIVAAIEKEVGAL